jgi:hypothetical protein
MVKEYMKLYDLIIIKSELNTFNPDLIDLIVFHTFLYAPHISINKNYLYCKFIKRNKNLCSVCFDVKWFPL